MTTTRNSKQLLGILSRESIIFESLVIFSSFLLIYLTFNIIRNRKRNLPPGPFGLPFVGYIPFLTKYVHLHFIELGKKYGEVFSLQLGSQFVVVLNAANVIIETLPKPEFQGRPSQSAVSILGRISPFAISENDVWNEHKKLLLHSMKDLGFGKSRIEEQIQDEVYRFVEALSGLKGELVDPNSLLSASVSNNITSLLFSERYDYGDAERRTLDRNAFITAKIMYQASHHIFFPWLRKVPFLLRLTGIEEGCRASRGNHAIFRQKIHEHKETLDLEAARDYIDIYLVEMQRLKKIGKNTTLSDEALLGSMGDVFGAGSETTRSTVLWCVYVLAAFPDVQSRVRREVEEVVGPDRSPTFPDLKRMPLTQSVIMEVMRWKSLSPFNILRCTTENATVNGYRIPKGTTVMTNFWNLNHDPEIWSEPDSFLPDRFLSEDGHSVEKPANFIPFSIGKRACPGETMANVAVFLYLVSILQKFRVSFPLGFVPTFEAEFALTHRLKPFKVSFTPVH